MWEKTVMKREEIEGFVFPEKIWEAMEKLLKAQAEISYKAGEAAAYKKWEPAQFKAEKAIRQDAIREVVEWAHGSCGHPSTDTPMGCRRRLYCRQCWRDLKKEWGIKEER